MNPYKFYVGEEVFVHYKKGCAKQGRVESIKYRPNGVFFYVSINGLKHHKKCYGCDITHCNPKNNEIKFSTKAFKM